MIIKVWSIRSKGGKPLPQQLIIDDGRLTYFVSYAKVIALYANANPDDIMLDYNHKYSRTTIKYRNQFLGMTTKEIEAALKTNEITLTDLN